MAHRRIGCVDVGYLAIGGSEGFKLGEDSLQDCQKCLALGLAVPLSQLPNGDSLSQDGKETADDRPCRTVLKSGPERTWGLDQNSTYMVGVRTTGAE